VRRITALLAFSLIVIACGGDGSATTSTSTVVTTPVQTTVTSPTTVAPATTTPPLLLEPFAHVDPVGDCRFSFTDGAADCGPGADILEVAVDPSGPIVLTVTLADEPFFDADVQWLVEFAVSELACGLTNSESTEDGFTGTDSIGPYGYRVLTNENAPAGLCEGSLDGTIATIAFNIQQPQGPWTIVGGTQHVEIENLDDPGSSDDVAIDVPAG